ncbi:MAG: endolytic transglycosylase MltG [Bacillota bacterium]|nr:MAG: endolytic transglycosylase MltG [Bacillota bacterium]
MTSYHRSYGRAFLIIGRSAGDWARAARAAARSLVVRYLLLALAGVFTLGACGLVLAATPASPGSEEMIVFDVRPGDGAAAVASRLEAQGLVRDALSFRVLSGLLGYDRGLKTGRYELGPGQSTWAILRKIGRGQVITFSLTVPEGYTIAQMAALLEEKGLATAEEFRKAVERVAADGGFPFLPAERRPFIETYEGLLFPDTYFFEDGVPPEAIVRRMAGRTVEVLSGDFSARAQELGLAPFEVLTLASIIEKEAAVAEERDIISSVYHNRLRIGMKLDACPTVRYVLSKPPNEPLLFTDLEVVSPYNTYENAGLPPGPICAPGMASIRAALYPADTDFLYFVSKNDGTHHFSRTFEEHVRAVSQYQGGGGL